MTKYGFTEQIGTGLSASALAAIDVNNSQFPNLTEIARTRSFDVGNAVPSEARPPKSQRQAYAADMKRCSADARRPFGALMTAGGSLGNQWLDIVDAVQASPQERAKLTSFSTCVQRAGAPARWSGSLEDFLAWETGLDTHVTTDAARKAIDAHWSVIFSHCARPTISLQDRLLANKRSVFLQQNYQQVHQIEALAGHVVSATERQVGSGGAG